MQMSVLCILLLPSLSDASLNKSKLLGKFYLNTSSLTFTLVMLREISPKLEQQSARHTVTVETRASVLYQLSLNLPERISSFAYVC